MKTKLIEKIWLSTAEAADYLSTTPNGILNMVHRGYIKAYKLGRHNRYKRIELDQLLEPALKTQPF